MGMFNTYGTIQLKVGELSLKQYEVGDTVDIPDGVYVDQLGLVVIQGGVFTAELEQLYDQWGQAVDKTKLIFDNQATSSP